METGAAVTGVHTALRGRADECGLLDSILADIRRGDGRSLVLRGEASMGKTALLQYLIGSAPDMTVLRAVGVEAEMELVYAGLHRLCGPIRGRLVAQERQIAEPAPRRAFEPREGRAVFPESAHGGVAPPPRIREARDPLAPRAREGAAQIEL
jgi:hypothetical protein